MTPSTRKPARKNNTCNGTEPRARSTNWGSSAVWNSRVFGLSALTTTAWPNTRHVDTGSGPSGTCTPCLRHDAAGEISTPGVLTAADDTLQIGDAGVADMSGYGYQHVLDGADHPLFLVTLLLIAPSSRWGRGGGGATAAARRHRRSCVSSRPSPSGTRSRSSPPRSGGSPCRARWWKSSSPRRWRSRPCTRSARSPGTARKLIAGAFGLAFAGILTDLGVDGSSSVPTLLAFNVGVDLAQLVTRPPPEDQRQLIT
jgi:hypothetical protein